MFASAIRTAAQSAVVQTQPPYRSIASNRVRGYTSLPLDMVVRLIDRSAYCLGVWCKSIDGIQLGKIDRLTDDTL